MGDITPSLKLGYIHMDSKEHADVLQVLRMLTEPGAIDELGIGRIRDAFSDKMFPGTSTLQKHLKYFSLLPQLYRKATERKYNRLSEVKDEIIRLERLMTRKLVEGSNDTRGITGSTTVNKPTFVKEDPFYIYNSGLMTFGILRSPQVYELIFSASRANNEAPKPKIVESEELADDAVEHLGTVQFCSFPSVDYDFTKGCNLNLTKEDIDFITGHILLSERCKGSLLRFIVDNHDLVLKSKFPGISSDLLPKELARTQDLASKFADFIYAAHLRYNWIYSMRNSESPDEEVLKKFENAMETAKSIDIDEVLSEISISEQSPIVFCKHVANFLAKNDMDGLDNCIITREHKVKGSRRKIANPSYTYDKRRRIHYYKLSYRWEIVTTFARELGMEVIDV